MSDPCKGKQPGHKLPGGKICKGLLDTIEGKAKSRMARKFQKNYLHPVTEVDDDDDDDDDDDYKENNTTVRRLPHNPNYGKGNNDLTKKDYERADRFMKSGGRRKRRTRRRKKRSKKKKRIRRRKSTKKRHRRKSTKKKRRRRRSRRKKGGDRTVNVGGILVTNVFNKNMDRVGVRLANAIRDTYSENYDGHCESYSRGLYPQTDSKFREASIRDCKKRVESFRQHVFKLPPRGH